MVVTTLCGRGRLSLLEHSGVFLKAAIPEVQWVTISEISEFERAECSEYNRQIFFPELP